MPQNKRYVPRWPRRDIRWHFCVYCKISFVEIQTVTGIQAVLERPLASALKTFSFHWQLPFQFLCQFLSCGGWNLAITGQHRDSPSAENWVLHLFARSTVSSHIEKAAHFSFSRPRAHCCCSSFTEKQIQVESNGMRQNQYDTPRCLRVGHLSWVERRRHKVREKLCLSPVGCLAWLVPFKAIALY